MSLNFKHHITFLTAVAILLAIPLCALGDQTESGLLDKLSLTESTFVVGYGNGNLSEGDYEHVALIWHLGFDLKHVFTRLQEHRGILSFTLEPKINPVFNPETDVEIGISFGLKYRYPISKTWSVYALGSVGPHLITVQTQDQANGLVFFDTVGAGFSYFLTPKSALNLEYRFRHASNADIKEPNYGIDSHMVLVGYSLFY
jgi:hypothetical protein